jgi:hypothetical protein
VGGAAVLRIAGIVLTCEHDVEVVLVGLIGALHCGFPAGLAPWHGLIRENAVGNQDALADQVANLVHVVGYRLFRGLGRHGDETGGESKIVEIGDKGGVYQGWGLA